MKELSHPEPGRGEQGHNHGLRVQAVQPAEAGSDRATVTQQQGGPGDMSVVREGNVRIDFSLNCLFSVLHSFSNGVSAFLLLTHRSPLYMWVICPLSYIVNTVPNLSFSLNNAYGIL